MSSTSILGGISLGFNICISSKQYSRSIGRSSLCSAIFRNAVFCDLCICAPLMLLGNHTDMMHSFSHVVNEQRSSYTSNGQIVVDVN